MAFKKLLQKLKQPKAQASTIIKFNKQKRPPKCSKVPFGGAGGNRTLVQCVPRILTTSLVRLTCFRKTARQKRTNPHAFPDI